MKKNILILGASSGIGKSFLINSLDENNNVVGVSRSIEDKFLKEKLQHSNLQVYNFDFKDLSSSSNFLNVNKGVNGPKGSCVIILKSSPTLSNTVGS